MELSQWSPVYVFLGPLQSRVPTYFTENQGSRITEKLVCVKGGVTNYLFPCFIQGVHLNLDKLTLRISSP